MEKLRRLRRDWPVVAIAFAVTGSAVAMWAWGLTFMLARQMAPTQYEALTYAARIAVEAVATVLASLLGLFFIDPVDEIHDPGGECLDIAHHCLYLHPLVWVAVAFGWAWSKLCPQIGPPDVSEYD